MRRWGHPHTAVTGFAGGLLLLRNGWLILAALALVFAAGWLAHSFRDRLGAAIRSGSSLLHARAQTELERGKRVRAARRRDLEQARDRRLEREKRENARYWNGVRDGSQS